MTTRAKSTTAKRAVAKDVAEKDTAAGRTQTKPATSEPAATQQDQTTQKTKDDVMKNGTMQVEATQPVEVTQGEEVQAELIEMQDTQAGQNSQANGTGAHVEAAPRGPLLQEVLDELRKPFHPSQVTWKPGAVKGERALALAYADLRAYMNRLDEVCGSDWSVAYEPWGEDRIICRLTIMGVTRSSTGETTNEAERSEIGGTVAEAQAFKRAGAMFGLGRYLYNLPTGWADYDPATKRFTEKAKAKLTGILVQHYRRATDPQREMADLFAIDNGHEDAEGARPGDGATVTPELAKLFAQFNALGNDLYGAQWEKVCRRNVQRISGGKTQESGELTPQQIQQLITGMTKLKEQRTPMTVAG